MSTHRPGAHTREIDVKALRAWVAAGRPGSPRQFARRAPRRPRWPWWPTVITVAVVMALLALSGPALELYRDSQRQGVARWCISCHGEVFDTPSSVD